MTRCHVPLPAMPGDALFCAVHGQPLDGGPCPEAGRPAIPDPIHVWSQPDQVRAVENARDMMAGTRPIIVHEGPELDAEKHAIARGSRCWCDYTTIPSG